VLVFGKFLYGTVIILLCSSICSAQSGSIAERLADGMNKIGQTGSPKWRGGLRECTITLVKDEVGLCQGQSASLETKIVIDLSEVSEISEITSENRSLLSFTFLVNVRRAFDVVGGMLELENNLYGGRFSRRQDAHLYAGQVLDDLGVASRKTAATCTLDPAIDVSVSQRLQIVLPSKEYRRIKRELHRLVRSCASDSEGKK